MSHSGLVITTMAQPASMPAAKWSVTFRTEGAEEANDSLRYAKSFLF